MVSLTTFSRRQTCSSSSPSNVASQATCEKAAAVGGRLYEAVVGHALRENQRVVIRVIELENEPDEATRRAALNRAVGIAGRAEQRWMLRVSPPRRPTQRSTRRSRSPAIGTLMHVVLDTNMISSSPRPLSVGPMYSALAIAISSMTKFSPIAGNALSRSWTILRCSLDCGKSTHPQVPPILNQTERREPTETPC